jgi:DNA topoisomerase VI subunit A
MLDKNTELLGVFLADLLEKAVQDAKAKKEVEELYVLLQHEWLEESKWYSKLMRRKKWDPEACKKSKERCIFLTNLFEKITAKWKENRVLTPYEK